MHKLDLFKAVLKTDTIRKTAWVVSAFSIINEDNNAWQNDPYPYRIVQTTIANYYVDPNTRELKIIEGCQPGQSVFKFKERIVLYPEDMVNVLEETETTIGNAYFNKVCLCDNFGSKIKFIKGRIDPKKIEDYISKILVDTPKENEQRQDDVIYVDEYVQFANSVFDLTVFSQLCTWGLTPKTILPPPNVSELKNSLIEANKDRLHDPAVIAAIEKQLIAHDSAFLKGDPGENFLLSSKSRDIVRKKMFLDYGAERGFDSEVSVDFIGNSLLEGWQMEKFPTMNNALRSGTFDRGSETQLGGVTFKEILRATSNITISGEDCGTKVGKVINVNKDNYKHLIGFNLITDDSTVFIKDDDQASQYLGLVVKKRSMMYCVSKGNSFCKTCAGFNLANNPFAASMAAAEYGSAFLSMFLKSMHGKTLATKKLDIQTAIT